MTAVEVIFSKFKLYLLKHWVLFLLVLLIFINFYPSLSLGFSKWTIESFLYLDKDITPISTVPLSFFFSPHGVSLTIINFVTGLVGYSPEWHYLLNLFMRILASVGIYLFVYKVSHNRIFGILSGLLFGLSYPGIEVTSWVTLYSVFMVVLFFCVFLIYWTEFLQKPNKKLMLKSTILFFITLFIYPARIYSMVLLVITGDFFYLLLLRHKHNLKVFVGRQLFIILLGLFLLRLINSNLSPVGVGTGGIKSPEILVKSLLTGNPPIVYSFLLFLSNLIISPDLFTHFQEINAFFIRDTVLLVTGLLLAAISLLNIRKQKKNLSMVLLSIVSAIIPLSVVFSGKYLIGWEKEWVISVQIGSTYILLGAIQLFSNFGRRNMYSEIGIIGLYIMVMSMVLPWLVGPSFRSSGYQHQSAFLLTSRYYTVAAMGSSIFIGSLLVTALNGIKNSFRKKINYGSVSLLISLFYISISSMAVISNFILSRKYLSDIEPSLYDQSEFIEKINNVKSSIVSPR